MNFQVQPLVPPRYWGMGILPLYYSLPSAIKVQRTMRRQKKGPSTEHFIFTNTRTKLTWPPYRGGNKMCYEEGVTESKMPLLLLLRLLQPTTLTQHSWQSWGAGFLPQANLYFSHVCFDHQTTVMFLLFGYMNFYFFEAEQHHFNKGKHPAATKQYKRGVRAICRLCKKETEFGSATSLSCTQIYIGSSIKVLFYSVSKAFQNSDPFPVLLPTSFYYKQLTHFHFSTYFVKVPSFPQGWEATEETQHFVYFHSNLIFTWGQWKS